LPKAEAFWPDALAPKPPAAALEPPAVGGLVVTVWSETKGPVAPLFRPAMAWSTALSCEPLTASVLVALT